MSDIGKGLYQYLMSKSTVTSLCGTRGYPEVLPQGATLPAFTYSEVDANSFDNIDGESTGLRQTRLQVNCFSEKHSEAQELRERIRLVLQGYRGVAGLEHIRGCSIGGYYGRYEPPINGKGSGRHLRSIDFIISHTETSTSF